MLASAVTTPMPKSELASFELESRAAAGEAVHARETATTAAAILSLLLVFMFTSTTPLPGSVALPIQFDARDARRFREAATSIVAAGRRPPRPGLETCSDRVPLTRAAARLSKR